MILFLALVMMFGEGGGQCVLEEGMEGFCGGNLVPQDTRAGVVTVQGGGSVTVLSPWVRKVLCQEPCVLVHEVTGKIRV